MAIPTTIERNLEQSGIIRTMAIDLSDNPEDKAQIIEILRSKLYSDKWLACIREYSTNAADSHVESGIGDVPIKVTLPTQIFPELRIRDFGIGLTPDEIDNTYTKYGRSTKRNTNSQAGQLGLGCKSAFCYGDNFVVISYKSGMKTMYNLTSSGKCDVISSEPMEPTDCSGIEVVIPIKSEDINTFQTKAMNFFKYWKICPDLTGGDVAKIDSLRAELEIKPLFCGEGWEIRPKSSDYYSSNDSAVVMGNIPYPMNWEIAAQKMGINTYGNDKLSTLFNFIKQNRTILRFDIGELDFSASRESLEYTDKTCDAIIKKITTIVDSIFSILESKVTSASDYWNAMLTYNQVFSENDAIFRGNLNRIEELIRGKIKWNGIPVTGRFGDLDKWDKVLGYSATRNWKNSMGYRVFSQHPVLSVFDIRNGKIKAKKVDDGYNNSIMASIRNKIIIQDMTKSGSIRNVVKYVFAQHAQTNALTRVYVLTFKDSAQKKEFFDTMSFDSVPVIYVSGICDEVKKWVKSFRNTHTTLPSTVATPHNTQTVRTFTAQPRKDKSGYYSDRGWSFESVYLHTTKGIYVNIDGNEAIVNGGKVRNIDRLSHLTHCLFTALGELPPMIYGISDKNSSAKWFEKAEKSGQWVKLETYIQKNKKKIISLIGHNAAKATNYFKHSDCEGFLGIKFAESLFPLLSNPTGDMYKACKEISSSFLKAEDYADAMKLFNIVDSSLDSTPFNSLFENVNKTYPMLVHLMELNNIRSNSYYEKVTPSLIVKIAEYVNLIDNSKKV